MADRDLMLTLEPAADATPRPLVLTPGEDLLGFVFTHAGRALLFVITCTSVLAVLLILFFVVLRAVPFLTGYSLTEFLTSCDWLPTKSPPTFGALPLIVGSLYVSLAALLFAVPVGLLAAVFLSDIVSWKEHRQACR